DDLPQRRLRGPDVPGRWHRVQRVVCALPGRYRHRLLLYVHVNRSFHRPHPSGLGLSRRTVFDTPECHTCVAMYTAGVPKLWNETIALHRETVRATILDATWQLVSERGLAAVTMSQIAEQAGIGRATLYKYFPDVEAILLAWHERQISGHLAQLAKIRAQHDDPVAQLHAVLTAYAFISRH